MQLKTSNGYNISYADTNIDNPKYIILAVHGFLGDKNSSCIKAVEKLASSLNIGLVKFDLPAHGESNAKDTDLTVRNCLSDIDRVVGYIKDKYKNTKIIAFATSFGGYLTLLYNYYNKNIFDYMILRSPAINMYNVLMENIVTEKMKEDLLNKGYFDCGFDRKNKIYKNFIMDLDSNNINDLYLNEKMNNTLIIHGTLDDIVPVSDSINFSNLHKCDIKFVDGADHRYKKDGELDKVLKITKDFINDKCFK